MGKFFQRLGIIVLICFSFLYTEKTVSVLIENDALMTKIREEKERKRLDPINAIVNGNTIIPGISGYEVDELASYYRIKRTGTYNKELLEYNVLLPIESLINNYNKYIISGNEQKRSVSLIFKLEGNVDVSKVLNILNEKGIRANFVIDYEWYKNNEKLLLSMYNNGHEIGVLDYDDNNFNKLNRIIKNLSGQNYCYLENADDNILRKCSLINNYTIKPQIIIKNYPSLEIKDSLKKGEIISLPINGVVLEELNYIINYIYSKGLTVETLEKLLNERRD